MWHWLKGSVQVRCTIGCQTHEKEELPCLVVEPAMPSNEAKFAVVLETQPMNEAEKAEYCRKKGLYPDQVERWRATCISGMSSSESTSEPLKAARNEIKRLKRKVDRKDKALAESAALLVL